MVHGSEIIGQKFNSDHLQKLLQKCSCPFMTKSVCFIERNFILDIEWSRTSKRNEAKVLSLSLDSTFNNIQSATAFSLGSSFMYR